MYHFSGLGHDFPDPSLVVSHLASRIAEGLWIGVNFFWKIHDMEMIS